MERRAQAPTVAVLIPELPAQAKHLAAETVVAETVVAETVVAGVVMVAERMVLVVQPGVAGDYN